ncbi:MAG: hypothetical protein P1U53_00490 [Sulfitobacter sp.]|nr:hypothetical protein [Sulfitobacter sp.]
MSQQPTYRDALIPGLGRIKIPQGMTPEEVAAQIAEADQEATPAEESPQKAAK